MKLVKEILFPNFDINEEFQKQLSVLQKIYLFGDMRYLNLPIDYEYKVYYIINYN